VVRNPYDRMKSYYKFLKYIISPAEARISTHQYSNFNDFILHTPPIVKLQRALWTQTEYLSYNNKIYMDKIIKYENLNESLDKLFKGLGHDFSLKHHLHKTKDKEKIDMTPEVRDFLYERYKDDFINFSYPY
jgi:hypothetical protein